MTYRETRGSPRRRTRLLGDLVRVPPAIMAKFGGRVRVPVRIEINGAEHRTTICNMGAVPMIGVPATLRRAAGIQRGQRITLRLEVNRLERHRPLPADLARALRAAERRAFDAMAYSHRKEYVLWAEDAKRLDTRARRIEQLRAKRPERLDAR